jgi:uncharacterized repeat protein (TIGR01451 family)
VLILFWQLGLGAAETRILGGHVPEAARNLIPIGRVDPSQRLNLAIGLPLRNQDALINLLREIYDPGSQNYHQYLTPEQFTENFGPSPQDYESVVAFAEANGLSITYMHGNRVLLDVSGTVADIEKAFQVRMQVYQHPTESRTFYAPDTEPSVGASVPILDISGLNNFKLPRPLVHKASQMSTPAHPLFGSGSGGTYLGKDFRAAYAPGVAANGFGQAVGLLEFDGYYASDITSYETQASLPNVPLTNVLLDGFNGSPGGANIEVALDIEVAIAMAPGLSQVIVYEAGPSGFPNDILNRMASDNLAKQISSSWTWSGSPSSDSIFQQLAAQGQSFFQASGDSDAYTGAIPQPADSPYITVVGGTTLTTSGPGGAWTSETTWNWYNSGTGTNGASGGISTSYTIPAWQQGISMSANQGSTTMRNIPDVALTADNVWVAYGNGSSGAVGGTSCAAPLWAGFTALINQQAAGNGRQPVGFINPAIYSLAQGPGYSSALHDVTTGNNTNKSSPSKFYAVSGFDLCTGWGTPAGSGLINALAGPTSPQVVSNSLVLVVESCTNNAVDPGETVTMNFGLINAGSANTTNLVATLQASGGVTSTSSAQTYGVLTAGGSAVTRAFSFTASGSCGGIVTATLQLQDGASNLGTVSFTIRLGAVVAVTTFGENFDGVTAPALPSGWTTAVTSGIQANWVTTNGFYNTAPNSAFAPDAGTASQTELDSPVIPISSSSAQLTFRQTFNLANRPSRSRFYNGGVLQISIGGGAFADILSAGGSFVTGGYNCTLATGTGNPLGGAQAWGGTSNAWFTTTVDLPAAAAGQNIQLKWVLGTGANSFVAVGWFVDSISIQDSSYSCCTSSADVGVGQTAAPSPGAVGQNLAYTLTVSNAGPSAASNVAITDALPSSVTFVSASPGCINLGGSIACTIATLAGGATSNVVVTVKPTVEGTITNSVSVTSTTPDPNSANNLSVSTTTVYTAPSITAQPTNQVTGVGGSANFYVTASGTAPVSYQWTFGGTPVTGATTTTLGLVNVQANQAGNYAVVVANSAGSLTSSVATLTVLIPPSVTAQPTNQTVVTGANASFQIQAAGSTPLSYQWLFNGANLAGATATRVALNNVQTNQAGSYSVLITNGAGSTTSAVASLTVLIPPSISLQPSNQTAVVGQNVSFQAGASGSTPLSYQWFSAGAALAGATTSSLLLTNIQASQAAGYWLVATNAAGGATSVVAQLTVLVPPSIISQPTNQTVVAGNNANFQVSASGTSPLNYQWWFDGTNAVGANTNPLSLTNAQTSQAGGYSVIITNSAGSVTSMVATLTVGTPPSVTNQPSSLTVVQGQNATFSVSASGDKPLSYQWRFNGAPIGGGSSSNYTVVGAAVANAGGYDAVVSNAYGSATSTVAQLMVLVPPSITSQPTNQTVVAGSSASFQVSASGTSPLNYQWWFNGTNAVGANTNSLSLTNTQTSQAGGYSVVITNSAGSVTSAVATLTVGTPPSITNQPSNLTVVQGQNATFSVAASGDAPLSYQWRFNGAPVGGGSSSTYTVVGAAVANAGGYDAVVSNAYGSATSTVAQLTVLVPPSITSQPTNQTVVAGSSASFQVSASGTSPLNYQWWFDGTNAVGANTNSLSMTNAQTSQAGGYSVVITNSAGSVTSMVATLTVGTPPSVTNQPSSLIVIQGQNATFSVSASGDTPLSYQWRFNGISISGGTSSTYTVVGAMAANAGSYDAVVSNAYGSATSTVAQLTVLVPPSITSQPTNQTVVAGSSANFWVSTSGTSPLNYQWWFNGTNAVGASTNSLSLTNAQTSQAGGYSVVITNSGGSVTSMVATLTVGTPPSVTNQPSSLTVVQGQNATFSVSANGDTPLSYQWRFNGISISGGTSSTYTVVGAAVANAGSYDAVVSNAYGSATSTVAQLTVLVPPSITSQPTNQTVVAGSSANFWVSASGTSPLNYQWWFNGTNALGANTNVLSLTNAQTSQSGGYSVVIANSAGSVTSTVATLTVGSPPSITNQPSNLTVVQGQNATFVVSASGDIPLNYQWRFNGAPIGGGASSSYTVVGATVTNAGSYDAVVSNAYGSTTSTVAQLTVLIPPSITNEPTNQTVVAGGNVNFQVSASGTAPLGYQWWFNGTNTVGTGTNILSVINVQTVQAGGYSVVITNSAGSVTSSVAELTVLMPPSITSQPTNQTSLVAGSVSFSVNVIGTTPLTYQWTFNGAVLPGATANALSLTSVQPGEAGMYAVTITNAAGSTTSSAANLTILVPPLLATPTVNATSVSVPVSTLSGLSYLLEYKNALQDPSWTAVSSWQPGTGNVLLLGDTNSMVGSRFYRVRCQ